MSSPSFRVWPGKPYPLGATWDGMGVNFAIFSENATRVELCLFDSPKAKAESHQIPMSEYTDSVWHAYLPDVRPGQLYGYRVHGPWDPVNGKRFNANKLLLDPYAKAIARGVTWHDSMFSYRISKGDDNQKMDTRNNVQYAPLAAVVDSSFNWGDDRRPNTPWHKTIIYEAHVKGMTMLHPDVPPHLRGTYWGFTCEPVIDHLKRLGVTSVELMPVHAKLHDRHLLKRGLSNFWGYNTLGYFAPEPEYSKHPDPLQKINEFKTLVRTLHANNMEVILDVVYNHTAEGDHLGPHLSFRGIDNQVYYRLVDKQKCYYQDFTGCGNTLNMRHPRVLQLIMDSLRYWILEMHVDGFRFDLASALARELYEVDQLAAFFEVIHQDPVISQVKLIAEPWDLGEGGYQVGNFPVLWTEWNGKYRDVMRSFWKGDHGVLGEFATRLVGSSDLYGGARRPYASINFVTCHDGFTLRDLVSYSQKHNEANKDNNRDGDNDNRSWNCGVEGETKDVSIKALRNRQMRNFLATLFFSSGVPMINSGDEYGRTQYGNNNTYCHDNERTWLSWEWNVEQQNLLNFVSRLAKLRKGNPVFERRKFFKGKLDPISGKKDITWYAPSGLEMQEKDWQDHFARSLAVCLSGALIEELDEKGHAVIGDTLLLVFNAHSEIVEFRLPIFDSSTYWLLELSTVEDGNGEPISCFSGNDTYPASPRSLSVFLLQFKKIE